LELALIQIDDELEKRNLKSALVMQVYDSIVVECPDEEVDEVCEIVKNIMENVNKPFENINRVYLKSDVEIGVNLADVKGK
jgi:DNA polymerase-1